MVEEKQLEENTDSAVQDESLEDVIETKDSDEAANIESEETNGKISDNAKAEEAAIKKIKEESLHEYDSMQVSNNASGWLTVIMLE